MEEIGAMREQRGILLTGATGLLGRYLLRDLLLSEHDVAVLVRDGRRATAEARIEDLVNFWSESLGVSLTRPTVLPGDVSAPRLGLSAIDCHWLSHSCSAVLHAAAHIGLCPTLDGEPRRTNTEGTQHLLRLCDELNLDELHHVSTAFVSGDRPGPILEDELSCGQGFHNDYEKSKFEAERLVRQASRLRVTVYRPSVLVGDSRTGYTSSYQGFYRFLELGDRLAGPGRSGRRWLPLRVPFTGEEPRNLVPVDWVAGAIVRLVTDPGCHGRNYHLVARRPVPVRLIKEVAEEMLAIDGVRWAGPDGLVAPSPLEEQFLEQMQQFWPYRDGDPIFDCANTRAALPGFPPPVLDLDLLARLMRFAVDDRWGRERRRRPVRTAEIDCAHYVEEFFPQAVQRSTLTQVPLDVTVGLDVNGPDGGQWTCRWAEGKVVNLQRGRDGPAEVVYRLDTATFAAVVGGWLRPQQAFLSRRIQIEGHIEKGLKLAVLFEHLVRECPFDPTSRREPADAKSLSD
jgi:nucleoside-diphosphate-sugar epimerase